MVEETEDNIFLSLKNGIPGVEINRDTFLNKNENEDHLDDVIDWIPFFVYLAFSKQLVQFELLHKGGKHL